MVPYGISVPDGAPRYAQQEKQDLRRRLGLPIDRKVLLSVGWISSAHKRMDYLVNEVASLPKPRPYVLMLGAMDQQSHEILALANEKLGSDGYTARSVPYGQVEEYYRAADVFVLCSLREGFGRVYLEALVNGLPCVVHDHPVMRYVLSEEGIFEDLSRQGSLARVLGNTVAQPLDPSAMARRRDSIRKRFSWPVLASGYGRMFNDCLAMAIPPAKSLT